MGRKTYSLSAVAIVAAAGLSFSNADGAVAFAQDGATALTATSQAAGEDLVDTSSETYEVVPVDAQAQSRIQFVSSAVVQPIAQDAKDENNDGSDQSDTAPGSLSELVADVSTGKLSEQMQCLAGAVYFEARGEPLTGQLAVAQVIINRSEDGRFPTSYCGVVHQRSQFSFVKNGRMPHIRTNSGAWSRAKAIAKIAHEGMWQSEAADAVFFHAKYVKPSWSRRKVRTAQIDTHIFYR